MAEITWKAEFTIVNLIDEADIMSKKLQDALDNCDGPAGKLHEFAVCAQHVDLWPRRWWFYLYGFCDWAEWLAAFESKPEYMIPLLIDGYAKYVKRFSGGHGRPAEIASCSCDVQFHEEKEPDYEHILEARQYLGTG